MTPIALISEDLPDAFGPYIAATFSKSGSFSPFATDLKMLRFLLKRGVAAIDRVCLSRKER
jgi:hypothetical protein